MFLNIDISQADFALARSGLTIEFGQETDSVNTRKFLEEELGKVASQIINKTYGYCAQCKKVFIRKKSNQIYCPRCKK